VNDRKCDCATCKYGRSFEAFEDKALATLSWAVTDEVEENLYALSRNLITTRS
jgi:hypothetical protein